MVLPIIQKRRSIREFSEKQVEAEKIDKLIEAALRAPSSMTNQPWKFIVVTTPELLERLSMAKQSGSTFLKNAPLGIVVCADQGKSDVWVEDCSIAAIFIQLTAESLGLGSCWIQIRERMHNDLKSSEAFVSEVLNIPMGIRVASIMAIGNPDEKKSPHREEDLLYENVYVNSYDQLYKG